MSAREGVLILDGVENPANVAVLRDVAAAFGWGCALHDRAGLGDLAPRLSFDEVAAHAPLVALENAPGAGSVFGFALPPGSRPALVVGNERRGIGRDVLAAAHRVVEIPLASRRVDTLNVGAAVAVALSLLARGGGGSVRTRADPERHRPELLLLAPSDAVELGSALRSAAAFGWSRVRLDDRRGVWFGADRAARSPGLGAARRGKNTIRVVPGAEAGAHDEVVVVTAGRGDAPLHRLDLARGARQLVVLPDEGGVDLAALDLRRLGATVRVAGLDAPALVGRYRATASIALAEVARQVGVGKERGPRRARPPTYGEALRLVPDHAPGEDVLVSALPE